MADFDPRVLLDVASLLQEWDDFESESFRRSIANRCYYASYGFIRKELESRSHGLFENAGKHTALTNCLNQSNDPHVRRIGSRLYRLRVKREQADYEFSKELHRDEAIVAMNSASRMVEKASRLSDPQWERIVTTAKATFRKR